MPVLILNSIDSSRAFEDLAVFKFKLGKDVVLVLVFALASALSILAAERILGVDRDYQSYLDFFEIVDWGYSGRFEPGFVIFNLIVKQVFGSFWSLLLLVALVSLLIKFYLISKLPHFLFWVVLYCLVLLPLHELTQLRAALAIGFVYLALYSAAIGVKRIVTLATVLIAASFHASILIMLPFVLLWPSLSRPSWLIFLGISVAPAAVLFVSIELLVYFNPLVMHLLDIAEQMQANPFSARNLILIAVLAIGAFSLRRLPAPVLPWYYISVMGLGLWYGLMSVPVFAHRLLEVTMFSYFFWVPYLPWRERYLAMLLLLLLAAYLFFYALYIDPLFL